MKVATTRFGLVEVDDLSIIKMLRGPIGFEEHVNYCLIQHRPEARFRWMQSLDDPALAFVVADPSEFLLDYDVDLSEADAQALRLQKAEDAQVLTIISVSDGGKEITANLAAPIVINSKELIAMQVVLQDNRYSVSHPIVVRKARGSAQPEQDRAAQVRAA